MTANTRSVVTGLGGFFAALLAWLLVPSWGIVPTAALVAGVALAASLVLWLVLGRRSAH